jgi:CBS domain-containing protein
MICPSCGYDNIQGHDECAVCQASLMQEDVPQPDTPARWRIMVDPISSLDPSTIAPQMVSVGTSLADCIARMQEMNVGYVLVCDTQGRLAGIFTEHDIVCRVAGQITDLASHPVDAFMTPNPTTLRPSDPIAYALHFMGANDFMYIPIVDDAGRPTDLLSFRRVIRLIEQMH